jgi:hypothetical protein
MDFSLDITNMTIAIRDLKQALAKMLPTTCVEDGGNYVVAQFDNLYEACAFAKSYDVEHGGKFIVKQDGHTRYLAFRTTITLTYA